MYKVKMTFTGLSPLRMNRFSSDMLTGTSKKLSKDDWIKDAYTRSYQDDQGYYVPGVALKTCIGFGGKKVKVGKFSASSQLRAILHIEPKIYFSKEYKPEILEGCVQVPPKSGARVIKYWVCFPVWKIDFEALIIDDRFPVDAVKNSAFEAGLYYGLLDGRPEYGRFALDNFEKI